uniref:ribosomal protein L28 n=1 Tax=Hypnea nidulans TaxID=673449 RepID=UPI0027D9FB04|nr:ribosomal protein L28 [Hypnea nidulans]WCH54508.1 ribosomal protein L28 [Hypnea nidulans]
MSKICQMTGKKSNNGYTISHSHTRTKKKQEVNLQNKKIWSYKKNKWIRVKISTKGLKSFYKLN